MSIAVKSGLPSLGSTEGAVITKDDISVTEETSPSASAGEDLPRGKSAYEVAVENGFSGTETEWLASLKGATGAPGADGKDGEDGKTPYVGDNGNWYIGADDTGKPSRGAKGEPGQDGVTPTFSIESVETGEPGTDADVTMTGDAPNHGLKFVIPRGNKGDKGDPGATPNLTIGTVTTLEAGQNATASMGGTAESPVLNLGIPKGAKGEPGQGGSVDIVTSVSASSTDSEVPSAKCVYDLLGNVTAKMDANNPVGTGSFSMNRKAGTVIGNNSHAEGSNTTASGSCSHAEGNLTTASGNYSHAEGSSTTASGARSHAEGMQTVASGHFSHAEGIKTTAKGQCSHVQGQYNIEDTSNTYSDIIGNGTSDTARSNAATVDWEGNAWFAGDVYTGSTSGTNKDEGSKKLATEEYVDSSIAAGGTDISLGLTSAAVGQIIKVKAVDGSGKPTAWEAANMPSGGGHWETVLDTVWEQDVINPTAFDSETGIFTCAEGELNNLELNKEYIFYQQCAKEGVAFNTMLNTDIEKVTKLSDTTFSINNVTPPTTFVPTNVKFSKGACLAVTNIDAKKIRLTLDGQFQPTATLYNKPFYGTEVPYFGRNTGYAQIRNAYQAYQQVTAEVESPYRIVGEILCGFNAPSQNPSFHFKNNSFCCPLVPYYMPEGNTRPYFLTSDGTKIAKLYSTFSPHLIGTAYENTAISNDYLKIISGTKVKLERWVE